MRRVVATSLGFALGAVSLSAADANEAPPVVVIVMENHSFGRHDPGVHGNSARYIVGNLDARYINQRLIPEGMLFTHYYANAHPSLPNYLDMMAGSNGGCTADSCPIDSIDTNNLFHQLGRAGISFNTFVEGMPSNCAFTSTRHYEVQHNPEAYFRDVDANSGLPYKCTRTDVPFPAILPNPLPAFSLVVPHTCHSMDGSSPTGPCPQ